MLLGTVLRVSQSPVPYTVMVLLCGLAVGVGQGALGLQTGEHMWEPGPRAPPQRSAQPGQRSGSGRS